MKINPERFIAGLHEYIGRALSPLAKRIIELEARQPERGEKGQPGDTVIGPPGPTGPKGDPGIGIAGTIGPHGKDGAQGPPGSTPDIEPIIRELLQRIPTPRDGRDGTNGVNGRDGESIRGEPGIPGRDGAVGGIGPVGPQGIQGTAGSVGPQGERGEPGLGIVGPPGPKGADGEDGSSPDSAVIVREVTDILRGVIKETVISQDEITRFISAEVARSMAAIPVPKDGRQGDPGREGRDAKDGANGRDGNDGRDALEIVIAPGIEEGRSYVRGMFACDAGGIKRWDGVAWQTVVRGVASYSTEVSLHDPRIFTSRTVLTDGRVFVDSWRIPVPMWRGTWAAGEYRQGDMATKDGSIWHCQVDKTVAIPGSSEDWKLAVKRGNDGKAAKDGKDGEQGPPGKDRRYE